MKKVMILIVLAAWTVTMIAQNFQMRSTSMYNQNAVSASPYGMQVSAPGAVAPAAMYSTTYDQPASHARRGTITPDDDDDDAGESGLGGDAGDHTPVGAPLIPLAILAAGYAFVRRRKGNDELMN